MASDIHTFYAPLAENLGITQPIRSGTLTSQHFLRRFASPQYKAKMCSLFHATRNIILVKDGHC